MSHLKQLKSFFPFPKIKKYTDIADVFWKPSTMSTPVLWQRQTIEAAPDAVNFREKADTSCKRTTWRERTEAPDTSLTFKSQRHQRRRAARTPTVLYYSLGRLSSHKTCPRETFSFQMLKEYSRSGWYWAACLVILPIYFSLEVNGEELSAFRNFLWHQSQLLFCSEKQKPTWLQWTILAALFWQQGSVVGS